MTRMRVLGLTGSIGMGKTTTAALFAARGVPVHDSDAAIRRLYAGAAVAPLEAAFPGVSVAGAIDRQRLAERVLGDGAAMRRLEAIVHPLVRRDAEAFLLRMAGDGRKLVLLDIPLLFETGRWRDVDVIVVASAPSHVQRQRVLARPGMSAEKLAALLARQMPDAEKRRRAHFCVDSGHGTAVAEGDVEAILRALAFLG